MGIVGAVLIWASQGREDGSVVVFEGVRAVGGAWIRLAESDSTYLEMLTASRPTIPSWTLRDLHRPPKWEKASRR